MIELIFLVSTLVILAVWATVVIVTITIDDIRTVRLDTARASKPGARKWREKPLVSVVYDSEPNGESIRSVRASSYRQLTIVKTSKRIRGTFILKMKATHVIEKKMIRDAMARYQYDPATNFFEIIPRQEFPQSLVGVMKAYHSIALAQFTKVRAILGILPVATHYPLLVRKSPQVSKLQRWYVPVRTTLQVLNAILFVYVAIIAVAADQATYLLAYGTVFSLWLSWSITSHPTLKTRQKLAYLVLAPVSFGYFIWRVFAGPFSFVGLLRLDVVLRRVLS